ncbi:MAG: hypothetical protein H0V17_23920 [Deltaproteobacteria bacterium]|nr:hypothetical protein [Deltaproteobacteria bacterium]
MWMRLSVALVVACGSKSEPPRPGSNVAADGGLTPADPTKRKTDTRNGFFSNGLPTYIIGTTGDEHSDRAISGQAELIRSLLTPESKKLKDTDITGAWPANPIVYGGAHVNALIASIAADLPFSITAGKLTIGDRTFEGDGLALLTVVPARAGKYPEFLLFAGTGTPGVAEINSPTVAKVDAPIVIADAFGALVVGSWIVGADGIATAKLDKPGRRVGWRETVKTIGRQESPGPGNASVKFRLYEGSPVDKDAPLIALAEKGITTALAKLAPDRPVAFTVYIHPDQRSKATLTGNGGAGHVAAFALTLHVFAHDGLERLTAHEATHVITPQIWPPPGSPLFGEGIAVWTAGGYAGQPLASARGKIKPLPIREMLGSKFRAAPEGEAYPFAGIVVDVAVAKLGLANVRDHLYGATTATWDDACKAAGTTAAELDAAVAAALR